MSEFLTKETFVRGERIVLFSCGGFRWFSNKAEAEQCEKRRAKFFADAERVLKRQSTFRCESRPVGRAKR
jgi:hypothetical protein